MRISSRPSQYSQPTTFGEAIEVQFDNQLIGTIQQKIERKNANSLITPFWLMKAYTKKLAADLTMEDYIPFHAVAIEKTKDSTGDFTTNHGIGRFFIFYDGKSGDDLTEVRKFRNDKPYKQFATLFQIKFLKNKNLKLKYGINQTDTLTVQNLKEPYDLSSIKLDLKG